MLEHCVASLLNRQKSPIDIRHMPCVGVPSNQEQEAPGIQGDVFPRPYDGNDGEPTNGQ